MAVPWRGFRHPGVSPARSPAGSASGRGDPSPGPGGDMFAPRDQAGAEHPGGHGTPPAQPARGPRHPHPTAHLGKLGGSEGERQSDEQSGCSTHRLPPRCHREGRRDASGPASRWPSPGPMHAAGALGTGTGCTGYGGGSWGVLPAMQLAPGSTAGLSPLQGSLRRGVHGHVMHGIGGPAPRVPHAPPSCCARGAREGGGGFYDGGFYQRLCVAAAAAISPTPGGLQAAGGHCGGGGRGELPTSSGHAKACPGWGANSRQGKTLVPP